MGLPRQGLSSRGDLAQHVQPTERRMMQRPSLREQIPHLDAVQLEAVHRIACSGGRLPVRALAGEAVASLRAARAVRVDQLGGEVWLTHLGLLALVLAQRVAQVPALAEASALSSKGKGFVVVA